MEQTTLVGLFFPRSGQERLVRIPSAIAEHFRSMAQEPEAITFLAPEESDNLRSSRLETRTVPTAQS